MRQSVSDVEKLVAINEIREVMASYARPKSLPLGFIKQAPRFPQGYVVALNCILYAKFRSDTKG